MYHWDRDISGRLQRVSTPIEQGCEVSVHSDQMDPLPEEQQSQQGAPINPTAYRSMRDHIHPPRVSAPSCITIICINELVILFLIILANKGQEIMSAQRPFHSPVRIFN